MTLTPFESMKIAYDCVCQVTKSARTLNPAEQLSRYGVNTPEQCALIRHNICANGSIGVQRFDHSLNPAFLATLSKGWTFAQLAGTIKSYSQKNQQHLLLAEPAFTKSEKAYIAYQMIAEASKLLKSTKPSVSLPDEQTAAFDEIDAAALEAHFES